MATEKETIIIDIELNQKAAQKEAERLTSVLADQRKELAALRKQYKDGEISSEDFGKKAFALNKTIKDNSDALRQNTKEAKAQNNSINALRASVSKLTAERNNTNTATKAGAKRFKELTKEIKSQTDELKKLEGQAGDFRRNVGDYRNAIKESISSTNVFGTSLGEIKDLFMATKASILATIPTLGQLRAALITTGIGAIVVLIGALVAAFVNLASKTESFQRKWRVFTAILRDAAKPVFDFLNTGVKALIDGFGMVVDFLSSTSEEAAKSGKVIINTYEDLEKALQNIEDRERALLVSQRRAIRQEEELKNIRDDDRVSIGERIAANEQLAKIEQARLQEVLQLERDKLAAFEAELRIGGAIADQTELNQKIAEQRARVEEVIEESVGRQNESITNQAALERELLEINSEIAQKQAEVRLSRAEQSGEVKEAYQAEAELLRQQLENEKRAVIQRGLNKDQEYKLLLALEEQYYIDRDELQKKYNIDFLNSEAQIAGSRFSNMENIKEAEEKNAEDLNEINNQILGSINKRYKAQMAASDAAAKQQQKNNAKELADKERVERAKLQVISQFAELSQAIAGENVLLQKAVSIVQATINTYEAATLALKSAPAPFNTVLAGLTIANGLASVSNIKAQNVGGQAGGGGTFLTSGETYLKVGDNPSGVERVTVEPISGRGQTKINKGSGLLQLAGGGSVIAAGSNIRSTNFTNSMDQGAAFSRAVLAMSKQPIQVAVTDINKGQRQVQVRQNRAKA